MCRFAARVLFVASAIGLSPGYAQDVAPLTFVVRNTSDAARAGEPVSVGVPIPAAYAIEDPARLSVADEAGRQIACQIDPLARWNAPRSQADAPLKWVLVTVAPEVASKGTRTLRVVATRAAPAPPIPCTPTPDGMSLRVSPGGTVGFAVPVATFAPFVSVATTEGGHDLVTGAGRIDMVSADGKSVAAAVTEPTRIESAGPMRVVLVQRGTLGELRYTCRWYFHRGRDDVALDFRLENPLAYGLFAASIPDGQQYFASLEIVQPIAGDAFVVTTPAGPATLAKEGAFEVRQTWRAGGPPTAVEAGFSSTETLDGVTRLTGRRHSGAVDLAAERGGVTVVVDQLAENFPKAIVAKDGAIRAGLFPAFGHGPEFRGQYATPATVKTPIDPLAVEHYRFEGGRWKTHRVVFDFHAGSRDAAATAASAARVAAPLVAHPDPALVRTSGVLGILWAERGALPRDTAVDRFERFFDIMASDGAADPTGKLGNLGLPGFLARGGTYGGRQPFGWENFGDLPWGDGWCNLHYDWPAAMLSGFLRTGDPRLFERGRDMARFRRDYGQNHGQDQRETWRGAAFYEKGWWHGNSMPGITSHNWILGVLLHYVITGDEASREAAIENAEFLMRSSPGTWTGWWGSRIPGWAVDGLVDAWNFLGDPRYRDEASRGIARYEELEIADGAGGFHLNPSGGVTTVWMENIFFLGAAKYTLATGSPQALPLLARMRNWFKQHGLVPPSGSPVSITLPAAIEAWSPTSAKRPSVHHLWTMLGCLSYSAVLFDDADDQLWATALFEAATRYWQEPAGGKLHNPLTASSWSPITMRPLAYPNSESKVLANVLNFGAPHLGMRALMSAYP